MVQLLCLVLGIYKESKRVMLEEKSVFMVCYPIARTLDILLFTQQLAFKAACKSAHSSLEHLCKEADAA
jgi:hypothetical protein